MGTRGACVSGRKGEKAVSDQTATEGRAAPSPQQVLGLCGTARLLWVFYLACGSSSETLAPP